MRKASPKNRTKMTLEEITARLEAAGIASPLFDALCLAERFTKKNRAALLADRHAPLDADGLEEAVRRRERREPLQYIVGEWDFYGLPFLVDSSCLIPRPDTELLVEAVIERLPEGASLLDMCTGSGCVAIAAAKYRPDVTAVGADISDDAIAAARKNAGLNGVADRVAFTVHDLREPWNAEEKFDAVVANPPYVTAREMEKVAPELRFEPRIALTDEGDGLSLIRAFVQFAKNTVKKGGLIAVEHGAKQGDEVKKIFESFGLSPATLPDIEGRPRVTLAERN
ncbi:MAG: peptide chain release factor N(5)-glutamine methyltransferase [Clostridia bacterium]|nr:peptide chain release factor N(5)-glutamine methyltransferase [Clostridia bacterium]